MSLETVNRALFCEKTSDLFNVSSDMHQSVFAAYLFTWMQAQEVFKLC